MRQVNELLSIAEMSERKARLTQIRNASKALMLQLNISPNQNQLPFVLGIPSAKDNTQAISEWLIRQTNQSEINNDSFSNLRLQLRSILEDCTGYF